MRSILLMLCIQVVCNYASAQISQDFASPSAEEVNVKECPFDPEASAVILLDKGSSNYDDQYALQSEFHIRIKILKQDGLEFADVSVPYYSSGQFETLYDVEAVTINIDEAGNREVHRVDRKAIYYKKVNEYYGEMTFAFPQARVGSILEYKYRSSMKNYGGLRDWNFQSSLPVYFSSYHFVPAPNLEFTYQVQKKEEFPIVVKRQPNSDFIYFEMKNIPGLGNEPYMDAREDYVQKIRFQISRISRSYGNQNYMSSWDEVAKHLTSDSDFGTELKTNLPEDQRSLISLLAGKADLEKLRLIHNYVRNNYQWNRFKGIYADPGLKTLYTKKTGSSALINFALINLLEEAGLEAYPMIVSERGHGKINTNTPFLKQFNNTYAAVLIGGRYYYLNATDPVTPSHLTPHSILNTTGLIIKRNRAIITEIKEEVARYYDNIYINSVLSDNGGLSGDVQLVSREYARAARLSDYTGNMDGYVRQLKKGTINLEIDSLELVNKDSDTLPLEERFHFSTGLQTTDDYWFLNLSLFTGFEANPFTAKERFSNINFGYKRKIVLNNVIHLPSGFTIDALPKSIRLINADKTVNFTRELFHSPQNSQLIARITIDFSKTQYEVEEYPDVKEFFKKMSDLLNEQVVLKKKSL